MAASTGRKTSSSDSNRKGTGSRSKNKKPQNSGTQRRITDPEQDARDSALFHEIGLIVLFAAMTLLFCCNFGIIGPVGNAVSGFMFGLFGLTAYVVPILSFLAAAFWFANEGNPNALRKLIAGIVLFVILGMVCELVSMNTGDMTKYSLTAIYQISRDTRSGGGVLAGSLCYLSKHYLDTIGTVLVVVLCAAVSLILLTEKSLLAGMKNGGSRMRELSREDAMRRRENNRARRQEQEEIRSRRDEEKRRKAEEKENQKILRMERKVSGVILDTTLPRQDETVHRDDIHEIMLTDEEQEHEPAVTATQRTGVETPAFDIEKVQIRSVHQVTMDTNTEEEYMKSEFPEQTIRIHKEGTKELNSSPEGAYTSPSKETLSKAELQKDVEQTVKKAPQKYMFPPLSKLQKGVASTGDSARELKETAMRLQQTLNTFGVKVIITDISQGPSVTRYELQPEQGVKVSRIVGLADDIKLNLAATDIRIEAPIPGKAAIGIEVPNKENTPVALRDLFETKDFKEFPSNIAFAVGKDIAGKTVVADIAKMPHMLIAGATGSGKSVCINTLIMSILYKAHPDDVKLIMVDPKVVELSVYNGIPHLLIPVVTDPKKASAALHWGVSEMEDRYRKFADFNVRDLKGYNNKVESMREDGDESAPVKLPQIVIIVDELADLMMVCPGEVEESICRLAQLARAAGIHLIIATQRPSVDVITGLIKANMPSRVAFSVSSGVDSRTILDMNGAEKLLGKGDMLFYPQGYTKPARIQGAFVSDKEVSDVVDFLKNQTLGNVYAEDIEEKIKSIGSAGGSSSGGSDSELDEFFEKAGRFIIDKDKASIGMLQRVLKVGFNRAARIMDQLSEYGVVGEEEGTKPRKVLMSIEQFEQLVEDMV